MFQSYQLSFIFYSNLWLIIAAILGVSGIGIAFLILLMVGLVNLGLIDSFNLEKSEQSIKLPRPSTDTSQVVKSLPFSKASEKEEEIQSEARKIKEVLSEGYNYKAKTIKKIEPLIEGLLQTNDFIASYWDYFTPEKKIELIVSANYLEKAANPNYYDSFQNIFRLMFTKEFFATFILILKYFKNIYANPKNHLFIQFNQSNQRVARLILNKAKIDFDKIQSFRQIEAFWLKQGEHFQKTSTPEEWILKSKQWNKKYGRKDVNLSDYAVSRESMYEDEDEARY